MNIYLEQIEKSAGDKLRGMVSPAWMENSIAKKHGKEGLKGIGANIGAHVGGNQRTGGRSLLEGIAGGAAGAGIGAGVAKLLKKDTKVGAAIAGVTGLIGASTHGSYKSLKNQEAELHKKYSDHEKKACVDLLLEQGVDFDTAVELTKQAEEDLQKEAGIGQAFSAAKEVFAGAGKSIGLNAAKAKNQAYRLATGKSPLGGLPTSRIDAAKALVRNPVAQVAGAAGVAGAGALALRGGEKRACMEQLLASGVDFDTAVELTKQAELEVYGE